MDGEETAEGRAGADVLERLTAVLPDLPTKLAAAARHVIDQPQHVAFGSMRGAASACGVAAPTMLRLARHLGFAGYEELKRAVQQEVTRGGFGLRAEALSAGTEADPLPLRIGAAAAANAVDAAAGCDPEVLAEMAAQLIAARSVLIVGQSALRGLALMMEHSGRMALPRMRTPGPGYATPVEALAGVGSGDVVIAIGLAPYARWTLEAIDAARDGGATVMALTDRRSSPLAAAADLALFGPSESPHYYPSVVGLVVLIEAVLASVAAADPDCAARLDAIEVRRARGDAYLP